MECVGAEDPKKLMLYSYWRSSCAWRDWIISTYLLTFSRENKKYLKLNPFGCVPVLVDGDIVIADSLAIILYLEEKYPQNPLLPQDLQVKPVNYQAANLIGANMQPYQNMPIIAYIKEKLGQEEMLAWIHHHANNAFDALENLLRTYPGMYATGDDAFLADLFLAPQIHSAVSRFNFDLSKYDRLLKLFEAYKEHPAFQKPYQKTSRMHPHLNKKKPKPNMLFPCLRNTCID